MKCTTRLLIVICLSMLACSKKNETSADIGEAAQQVGDVMASIDESGGDSGTLATIEESNLKAYARLNDRYPTLFHENAWDSIWISTANAAACGLPSTFGTCSSGVITRTYGGCSIGGATFNGTVTLTWSGGGSCVLSASGQSITRVPDFTVTGRRGATLTVSKTGAMGQRLTWSSGSGSSKVFGFSNDGIQRKFTSGSTTLFDFTTQTTSEITVTGTSRSSRTMNSGSLRVTNNVSGVFCDYVPSNVSWSNTCNCAVSGTWTSTCSNGSASTLTLTGCGTGNFTLGSESEGVTFDRCYGVSI